MLRECHRVLRPEGLLVGYVIHTRDLAEESIARASELGPREIGTSIPYPELVASAGFRVLSAVDVTEAFADTAGRLLRAREELADVLRVEEGDDIYCEELAKLRDMVAGISEGLLGRSLITAVA